MPNPLSDAMNRGRLDVSDVERDLLVPFWEKYGVEPLPEYKKKYGLK